MGVINLRLINSETGRDKGKNKNKFSLRKISNIILNAQNLYANFFLS